MKREETPVDDVRRVRERLDREAGGDIHVLIEQSNKAFEEYRRKLGLRPIRHVPTSPKRRRRPR
jgi:hypothetical protein